MEIGSGHLSLGVCVHVCPCVHVCACVRLSGSHLFILSGGECEVKQSAAACLRVTESLSHRVT